MRVLMIGDVVGRPGGKTVEALLPGLRDELSIDLVIANGENLAGGFGITAETAGGLISSGVDVITSGNHIWDKKEIIPHLDSDLPILRPLNYPAAVPGRGFIRAGNALVVNLIGRLFLVNADCPFMAVDRLLEQLPDLPRVVLVDMHAEATSEKQAMGWHLDGRVSAVAGTHTHVATADARILPKGTAYVSDLGMVGATDSIIGAEIEGFLAGFLTQVPSRSSVAAKGPMRFNSVLFDVDDESGRATGVARIDRERRPDGR